jgi:DNA-binding YbaB/EbfC family protein
MLNKYKKFKELKKQAKTMETELATVISEGSAAWNKVKITINGNRNLIDVKIDKSMMSPENKDALQSAIKDAFKDATGTKFQMKLAKKMQEMGGLDALKNLGG